MAYTERGYQANSTNFSTLKGKVKILVKYNPVNNMISIIKINTKDSSLKIALVNSTQKNAIYTFQVAGRQAKFLDVESKTTRIGGAFASLDFTENEIIIIHNLVKRIRGENINALKQIIVPIITEETEEVPVTPTHHSVSHTSYRCIVSAIQVLITLLEAATNYDSNNADLKIPALKSWVNELDVISDATDAAHNDVVAIDVIRDDIFYDAKDSGLKMGCNRQNSWSF